jgi:hypothetical protein
MRHWIESRRPAGQYCVEIIIFNTTLICAIDKGMFACILILWLRAKALEPKDLISYNMRRVSDFIWGQQRASGVGSREMDVWRTGGRLTISFYLLSIGRFSTSATWLLAHCARMGNFLIRRSSTSDLNARPPLALAAQLPPCIFISLLYVHYSVCERTMKIKNSEQAEEYTAFLKLFNCLQKNICCKWDDPPHITIVYKCDSKKSAK